MRFYKETNFKDTQIGRIPKDWEVVRLGDIASNVYYGITAKAVQERTQLRMLRTTDIKNYKVEWDSLPYCQITEQRKDIQRYFLQIDDLIVSRAGTAGMSVLVDKHLKDVIFGSYLIKIRLKDNGYPKYLHFFFRSRFYWNHILSGHAGSTLKNINLPVLKSTPIILPPLPEQEKIAEILSTVDEVIQRTEEIIAKTERLKKGLMQELLTKGIGHKEFKDTQIGRIPKDWEVVRLGDISTISSGNTAPQEKKYFEKGKFPFIRVQHLNELAKGKYTVHFDLINERAVSELRLKKFKKGAIIFPKSGESIKLEKRAMLIEDSYVVNHLAVINPLSKGVNNLFLFYCLCRVKTSEYLTQTTMPSLNLATIKGFLLPLPPLPEQEKIAEILSTVDEKIEIERKIKEKLERIKKSLMDLLLTGKIRVRI
ncbi:restriction endonuclease subunit S [bacterium]|nr:restriction endonuclease subunit S [bacterium]